MALEEVAKATGSQPIGPGETSGGGAHGDAERDIEGAQVSMVIVGREVAPLGAWRGHMARDHGVWKDAQTAGSQPIGLGKVPGGGGHKGAEGNAGGALMSTATGG